MNKYENLSERLKPEYALILETDVKQQYPAIYKSINKAINEKKYITNLTIAEAEEMVLYVYDGSRDLNNIYKMFVI